MVRRSRSHIWSRKTSCPLRPDRFWITAASASHAQDSSTDMEIAKEEDIDAFFFAQEGLMAGMGVQGTKISRINPD